LSGYNVTDAHAFPQEEIYGTAFAAAAYLKSRKFDKKVYVIGEIGIVEELQSMGIETVGGPEHAGEYCSYYGFLSC